MKEFIEKLIERLEEVHKDDICDLIPNCDEFKNCKDCRKEFIKKIIEPVLEEYNGGWIPCEKELPKDGVVVDLSCEYMGVLYETVGYLKDGNRGHSYIVDNDVFMRSAVLAWKKRPAPYQPKGE